MNLKEFDAKQFLLEKGERVGLGIAVTLMVLMLIFSLFMPSKGFFSGSPAAKAEVLDKGATELDNQLRTKQIPEDLKPEPTEGRLINLDTAFLQPKNYEILGLFEPTVKETPSRRPPRIYNLEEAIVADARVLIDTYLFDRDFTHIWVLRESGRGKKNSGAGGPNPFGQAYGGGNVGASTPSGSMDPRAQRMVQQQQRRFNLPNSNQIQGAQSSDYEYEPTRISVKDWNPQELTARQPQPLRVAVIGGSFPYRRQLEEFKRQLRLPDISAVLNELLPDKETEARSFEFVGVEVQRVEVDAAGNKLGEWADLPLAQTYQEWLKHTFWPFQAEDPKYNLVKFDGLVLPLLREFHANKKIDPTMRTPGAMMQPGMTPPTPGRRGEEVDSIEPRDYPDVVAKLPKIQDTLTKLSDVQPARVAAPRAKTDAPAFDPFRPFAPSPAEKTDSRRDNQANTPNAGQELTIPEYALVRLVDVNLEPGKSYRYRVRIKMNNPNYQRKDVASPAYKAEKFLTSQSWYEIKQTAQVPPELMYYVVDEKQKASPQEQRDIPKKTIMAQSRLWKSNPLADQQVVFQFHRWVESVALSSRESSVVPVGEWAVADRVLVSRGDYVGQKVRIDLPIWKYSQNAYVIPAEEQTKKTAFSRKQSSTGIDVDFGFEDPNQNTILVDFEGGRAYSSSPKMEDKYRTEVLMLSADGKLLARNSARDTENDEREKRRNTVLKRIEDIRSGNAVE